MPSHTLFVAVKWTDLNNHQGAPSTASYGCRHSVAAQIRPIQGL